MSITPYPWMRAQWGRVQDRLRRDELPHALLLVGPRGLGGEEFAQLLAQSVLCEARDPGGMPCGSCAGCRWFCAGSHPDFHQMEVDADSRQIRVEQVRALIDFVGLSRQQAPLRVVVLPEADALNRNAANSLLKTLEEPPPASLFILVSQEPRRLPATILSRCQRIVFRIPARDQALSWLRERGPDGDVDLLLNLAHGIPPVALSLGASGELERRRAVFRDLLRCQAGELSVSELARQWDRLETSVLVDWCLGWWADLARVGFGVPPTHLDNSDLYQEFRGLSGKVDLKSGFRFQDRLLRYKGMMEITLNRQLLVEDVLLAWIELFNESSPER